MMADVGRVPALVRRARQVPRRVRFRLSVGAHSNWQPFSMIDQPARLVHPRYRADVDGLRALAIIAVVAFHAFPGKVPGGFVGVDVFFVISGFLISTIIFSSLEQGRFSLLEFYDRRIRRIFPALLLVLAASLVVGWYLLLRGEYSQLGRHTAGGALFIQNFILYGESGYFDTAAERKPLLHLWSLAIEEQFYLFWPLLLTLVWKNHSNMFRVTLVIALLSFTASLYLIQRGSAVAAFYLPVTRLWELMLGGALAYVALHRPELLDRQRDLRAVLGLALIVSALFLLNGASDFPGWWALLPTLGALLVMSAGPHAWVNRTLLSNRVMVWFGLISYPLYLWHWPLLAFPRIVDDGLLGRETKAVAILAAILLAWATYRYVERPIRRADPRSPRVSRRLVLAMTLVLSVGTLVGHGAWPPRHAGASLDPIIAAINDWEYPGDMAKHPRRDLTYYYEAGRSGRVTLMLGDSHMEQYAPRVAKVARERPDETNLVYFATLGSCPPIPFVEYPGSEQCARHLDAAREFIASGQVDDVVLSACWNCYFNPRAYQIEEVPFSDLYVYAANGTRARFADGSGKELALAELERFMRQVSAHARGFLILDNPISPQQDPKTFFTGDRLGRRIEADSITPRLRIPVEQFALRDRLVAMARRAGFEVIDPLPSLCDPGVGTCRRMTADGKPIYKDSNHLRPFFVRDQADYLDRAFVATHPGQPSALGSALAATTRCNGMVAPGRVPVCPDPAAAPFAIEGP